MMFQQEIDLSNVISFIVPFTVVIFFTTFLLGFAIKKLLQIMVKG